MGDISGETILIIITILVMNGCSMALNLMLYIRLNRKLDAFERKTDAFERKTDAFERRFNAVGEANGALGISRTNREREPSETAV